MKRIFPAAFAALVCAVFTASAAPAHNSGVTVKNVWARATPPGAGAGAVYAEIHAADGDTLIGAESPAADRAELHMHVEQDGVMKMTQVEYAEIPKGGTVKLQPGGLHVMLTGLNRRLDEGARIPVTFVFQHMDEVETEAAVLAIGAGEYSGAPGHAGHAGRTARAEEHGGREDEDRSWPARLRGLWNKFFGG